jgi:hypothetical protein
VRLVDLTPDASAGGLTLGVGRITLNEPDEVDVSILPFDGYSDPQTAAVGIVLRVTKAKKSTRFPQGLRKSAERLREVVYTGMLPESVSLDNWYLNQEVVTSIVSSSVEKIAAQRWKASFPQGFPQPLEKLRIHPQPPNKPSFCEENRFDISRLSPAFNPQHPPDWEQLKYLVKARRKLFRAEPDEESRRKLAVGKGPEVRR